MWPSFICQSGIIAMLFAWAPYERSIPASAPLNQSGRIAGCWHLKFQHLRYAFGRVSNVARATYQPQRNRIAVGIKKPAAHEPAGGRASE